MLSSSLPWMTSAILATLSTPGLKLIHPTPRYAYKNFLNENVLLICETQDHLLLCTRAHVSALTPCMATYEQCKTSVLNSTIIIIIQCVQGNFYSNKNLYDFNFGYLTNTIFLKILSDKLFQINTN